MSHAPIGIFDSGLGGLTVARAIYHALPNESTIYFGDTARVPYGPKSPAVVRRYSLEIGDWLARQGVKLVVVACNTSTAHALDALQAALPVPVLGVIEPGARAAVRASGTRPVGVIGTAGTIASRAYQRAIAALSPETVVVAASGPLLVPLVEEGWFDHPATRLVVAEYLGPLVARGIGSLVLGCTHYPLLKPLLAEVAGPAISLIDSAAETAAAVEANLTGRGARAGEGRAPVHRFVVSDDPERFRAVGARFLGERLAAAEVVSLGGH